MHITYRIVRGVETILHLLGHSRNSVQYTVSLSNHCMIDRIGSFVSIADTSLKNKSALHARGKLIAFLTRRSSLKGRALLLGTVTSLSSYSVLIIGYTLMSWMED